MQPDRTGALTNVQHKLSSMNLSELDLMDHLADIIIEKRRPRLASVPKPSPLNVELAYLDPLKMATHG